MPRARIQSGTASWAATFSEDSDAIHAAPASEAGQHAQPGALAQRVTGHGQRCADGPAEQRAVQSHAHAQLRQPQRPGYRASANAADQDAEQPCISTQLLAAPPAATVPSRHCQTDRTLPSAAGCCEAAWLPGGMHARPVRIDARKLSGARRVAATAAGCQRHNAHDDGNEGQRIDEERPGDAQRDDQQPSHAPARLRD